MDVSEKARLYNQTLLRYNDMANFFDAKPTPVVVVKTSKWNDRGELLHDGVAVPGSNMIDLVHDLLRKRKTTDHIGWQQFANQLSKHWEPY